MLGLNCKHAYIKNPEKKFLKIYFGSLHMIDIANGFSFFSVLLTQSLSPLEQAETWRSTHIPIHDREFKLKLQDLIDFIYDDTLINFDGKRTTGIIK